MAHKITRVWCQGAAAGFTYAYRCSCGAVEPDFISESAARYSWALNHANVCPETPDGDHRGISGVGYCTECGARPQGDRHPLIEKMRAGHKIRTGHELVAELVPDADGIGRIVRFCCKRQNAA